MLPNFPFAELVRDKLVLVALAGAKISAECLLENGALDVLILSRDGSSTPVRKANHVQKKFTRLADIRTNNCNVAILHGRAALALLEKRKFGRFSHILIPAGPARAAASLGLLRYGKRQVLVSAGRSVIECNGRQRTYLVLETHTELRDNRRQYGPSGLTPLELVHHLNGLDHVVLRWSEAIAAGNHEGDIDILISQTHLREFKKRFTRKIGTYPFDVYTDNGQDGHNYKSVPYFTHGLAKGVLEFADISNEGIRCASPRWRFLAFCYHLMFHNKSEKVAPGTVEIVPETFHSPHYHRELVRLAELAGEPPPRDFDEIERLLRDAGVLPSLDLIGFYSNKNAFLKKRYFDREPMRPGLATFFVRDFGSGVDVVPELRKRLMEKFEIIEEGPVDDSNRARVIQGVRGGNWADSEAPGGRAGPVYWFVCWDHFPRLPSARTRRKHPRVDNENIRLKDHLRRDLGGEKKSLRVIHSSDNTLEAVDHLHHLGLTDHPGIADRLHS